MSEFIVIAMVRFAIVFCEQPCYGCAHIHAHLDGGKSEGASFVYYPYVSKMASPSYELDNIHVGNPFISTRNIKI